MEKIEEREINQEIKTDETINQNESPKTNKDKPKQSIGRKIANILSIIISILMLPIIVVNGILIVKSFLNPDEIPDAFGYKPFIVLSGSMEPTILVGDLEIVKEVDPSTLKVDDIIAFKVDDAVVTHRIIEMTEKNGEPAFITKGDNNNVEDSRPVTYDQFEGVYVTHIKGLGDVALFIQTVPGIMLTIVLPLALILIANLIVKHRKTMAIKKELEEMKKEKGKDNGNNA